MFNAIVRFSLNNRLLVLAAAAMLMLYGAVTASRTPVDVFPDLNKPVVTCLLYTSPSPRDRQKSRMPSSA